MTYHNRSKRNRSYRTFLKGTLRSEHPDLKEKTTSQEPNSDVLHLSPERNAMKHSSKNLQSEHLWHRESRATARATRPARERREPVGRVLPSPRVARGKNSGPGLD